MSSTPFFNRNDTSYKNFRNYMLDLFLFDYSIKNEEIFKNITSIGGLDICVVDYDGSRKAFYMNMNEIEKIYNVVVYKINRILEDKETLIYGIELKVNIRKSITLWINELEDARIRAEWHHL